MYVIIINSDCIASWWCVCRWQRGWWRTWSVSWNWSIINSSISRCHSRSRVRQPWCLAAAPVFRSRAPAALAPWMPSAARPLPRLTTPVMFNTFFLNLNLKILTIWGEGSFTGLWYVPCWNTESSFCLKTNSEPFLAVSVYSAFHCLITLLLKENLPNVWSNSSFCSLQWMSFRIWLRFSKK